MAQDRYADVVVPVTLGGPSVLSRLHRILECSGPALRRLLVVEDGCGDRNLAYGLSELAASDDRIRLLRCPPGLGWTGYANRGLVERDGDIVLLMPDARPTRCWIEPLAEAAHSEERVALASPLTDGDGFDAEVSLDEDELKSAVFGLPESLAWPRAGLVCNYLRGDVLDAVGLLDPESPTPRAALEDWLVRACSLGFFAKRACRSIVLRDLPPPALGEPDASRTVDGGSIERHAYAEGQVRRFAGTLDASIPSHAVAHQASGRIRVALDVRHLPLEMNGTKMYAVSLGKALSAIPEIDLTLLAVHPLQADGIDGRLVSPDEWRDDVAIVHKPAQIFDKTHAKLLFESRAHVVITYQDLIAYRMAHVFPDEAVYNAYQKTSRLVLPAAQAILTYSENTAREVEAEFGIPREVIHPVLLGVDAEDFSALVDEVEATESLARLGLPGRYFLSLASDYPHKNLAGLIDAYAMLREWWTDGEPPVLALAGRAAASAVSYGSRPGVKFLGPVSHQDLRILYQQADSLVFPSVYEGFGLPPLEAMAARTPVVAMPFSSIPEVCGDNVLYAEGLAPVDLARAMQRLSADDDLRAELRSKGLRHASALSWRKTALETVGVYRKILREPSTRTLLARRTLTEAISLWSEPPVPAVIVEQAALPEPDPIPPVLPAPEPVAPTFVESEPMGVINACQALRDAVILRLHREVHRRGGRHAARFAKVRRLSSRFVQVARSDGFGPAASKVLRKSKNRARHMLRRFLPVGAARGHVCSYFRPAEAMEPYDAWRRVNGGSPLRAARLSEAVAELERPIAFSILTPVYNTPPELLQEAVESVLAQSYEHWELVLVDDASTDSRLAEYLSKGLPPDPRIRLVRRESNGNISAATNTAGEHATGEYLVLLDHDDLLHREALAHLAVAIGRDQDVDLLYSDDDKMGLDGSRFAPQFKPDWSPELLLSFCYTGHVSAVRASLYRSVGGMRLGFEGSQDHDFWLRASERARRIVHVPQVLYHWRVLPGSTAASGHEKPHSFEAGRKAVEEAFGRRGISCRVEQARWAVAAGCGVFQPVMPDDGPSVAVLIATKNQKKLLQTLLKSIEKTTYRNYRVYIIDNESDDPETQAYLATLPHTVLYIPNLDGRFNYAALHNEAVGRVEEDLLLFLNNDVEVIEPRWLSQMVGWSRLPGVGAVGARLLYSDRRVQHAGIVHGLHEGLAGHAFKLLPWWDGGAMGLARATRNCLAVTAACMLTPRRIYQSLDGFNAEDFGVAYNDADYGYRLHDAGYRSVVCAEAELFHHEGATRGFGDNPREEANYRKVHGHRRDPYFSLHHDPLSEAFEGKPTIVPVGGNDRPLRVAAFTHNLNWEGASRFELELVTGLKDGGAIEPIVFSPVEGPLRDEYERAGVRLHIDPSLVSIFGGESSYAEARARTVGLLMQESCHAVHANTLQGFWAIDAAREAGLPSVWSIHESEPWQTYFDQFPVDIARKALGSMEHPYRVVFTARSSAEIWKALDTRRNFGLVRYALNIDRFQAELALSSREHARQSLGIGNDEVCVLLLGTVCDRKGQHDLVRAFSQVRSDVATAIRCIVVGARDSLEYSRDLRRLAEGLPEDRRARFQVVDETGATADYWHAADVFCCTSRVESYPHVILEALGRGLPVVSTPVYGIPEQLRPGLNSFFYDPGDVLRLAKHLETLACDGSLRRSMGEASSWILRALPSHADMVEQYATIFRAAVESTVEGDRPSNYSVDSSAGSVLVHGAHGPSRRSRTPAARSASEFSSIDS